MKNKPKLILPSALVVLTLCAVSAVAKLEPWSKIEARTKFLRTNHYIEVVRIHSDVYKSARAKGGKTVPGPFPVHVIMPANYQKDLNRRYGVVYLLGGKSGWDNGPEMGGATYWSVWCKTPLTMDHLKRGQLTKVDFQDNIHDDELTMFNQSLDLQRLRAINHPYRITVICQPAFNQLDRLQNNDFLTGTFDININCLANNRVRNFFQFRKGILIRKYNVT